METERQPSDASVAAVSRHPVARAVNVVVGSVILVAGIIIAPTPIPIGIVLIAIGLFMLSVESRRIRSLVRGVRARVGGLDRVLRKVEPRLPRSVAHMVPATDPRLGEPGGQAAPPSSP